MNNNDQHLSESGMLYLRHHFEPVLGCKAPQCDKLSQGEVHQAFDVGRKVVENTKAQGQGLNHQPGGEVHTDSPGGTRV